MDVKPEDLDIKPSKCVLVTEETLSIENDIKTEAGDSSTNIKSEMPDHDHTPEVEGSPKQPTSSKEISWFQCPHCLYKVITKELYKKHVSQQHEGLEMHNNKIQQLQCIHCYITCSTIDLVKKHEWYYGRKADSWLYQCDQCCFNTAEKKSLKEHMFSVHTLPEDRGWYKCNYCDFKSKYGRTLRRHERSKHRNIIEGYLKCKHCDFITKHKASLVLHMKRMHDAN